MKASLQLPPRFRVVRELGRGAMATVYLADDAVTRSRVALKVLLPRHRDDPIMVERFRREVDAVRRIAHPGVAKIFDIVEDGDVICLVQEFVGGVDLKRRLRLEGPLHPDEMSHIAGEVLDILAAVHEVGIVHRDVKPQNLLSTPDGRVRLLDFGIALLSDATGLTTQSASIGTPEYAAPELMESSAVDGRADLYSLGATLYELLTGRPPFDASGAVALFRQKVDAPPPNPRHANPDVPAWLAEVTVRALEPEPDARFATAAQMARALEARRVAPVIRDQDETCPSCGAVLILGIGSCVECGQRVVTIDGGGKASLVIPRHFLMVGHEQPNHLSFREKERYVQILERAGARLTNDDTKTGELMDNFPCVLASGLKGEDAAYLAKRLADEDLPVRVFGESFLARIGEHLYFHNITVWASRVVALLVVGGGLWLAAPHWPELLSPYFLGAVGVVVVFWWIAWFVLRTEPILQFTGETGLLLEDDELVRKAKVAFERVRSRRTRTILRRTIERGSALKARLASLDWLPDSTLRNLERVMNRSVACALEIAELEEARDAVDSRSLRDRIESLDARLRMTHDTYDYRELAEEKASCIARLAEQDDRERAIARRYNQLLRGLAILESLADELAVAEGEDTAALEDAMLDLGFDVQAKVAVDAAVRAPHRH